MSIFVNILAAIGLVVIISYACFYLYQYIQYKNTQLTISQINPPGDYMQNSGIKCPDYWVNTELDSNGNYVCKNSFNIQSNNPTTGKNANKCNPTQMTFSPLDNGYTWQYGNPNGLTSYTDQQKYNFLKSNKSVLNPNATSTLISRCDWINSCGPESNVQGIWSGVNEICNLPPPS